MNLSGSKGQLERETEARSEGETDKNVCECVRAAAAGGEAADRWMYGDRKTGLVSPVA